MSTTDGARCPVGLRQKEQSCRRRDARRTDSDPGLAGLSLSTARATPSWNASVGLLADCKHPVTTQSSQSGRQAGNASPKHGMCDAFVSCSGFPNFHLSHQTFKFYFV